MNAQIVLKPSHQSLAARGLPRRDVKARNNILQSSGSDIDHKIESMNRGLEKCSSLLGTIMKTTDLPKDPKKKVQVISPTRKVMSVAKTRVKKTPYNKRLVSSTPDISQKKNNNKSPRKKGGKKKVDPDILIKNDMMDSDTVDELIEERDQLRDYLKGVINQKSNIENEYKQMLRTQQAATPTTVDRAKGVYQTLSHSKRSTDESSRNPKTLSHHEVPEKPYETVHQHHQHTKTTTSQDQSSEVLESLLKSITDKLSVTTEKARSAVTTPRNIAMTDRISPPSNFRNSSTGGNSPRKFGDSLLERPMSSTQDRSYYTPRKGSPPSFGNSSTKETTGNVINTAYCTPRKSTPPPNLTHSLTDKTNGQPTPRTALRDNSITEDRRIKRNNNTAKSPKCEVPLHTTNTTKRKPMVNCCVRNPIQPSTNSAIQFENNSTNGNHFRNDVQITTLTYLLKELHVMLSDRRDLELNRLLTEIDHIVGLLPFILSEVSSMKPPVDEETNNVVVVEHLQNENAELRRQMELVNKDVKAIEELKKICDKKQELELENGKNRIKELESKLTMEDKRKHQLSTQVAEVCKLTEDLRKENQNLLQSLSQKDVNLFQEKQMWLKHKSIMSKDLSDAQDKIESVTVNLQAVEKEKRILEISLKQRDSEIGRLTELNSGLQTSISTLLEDIEMERHKQTATKKSAVHQNHYSLYKPHENRKKHFTSGDPTQISDNSFQKELLRSFKDRSKADGVKATIVSTNQRGNDVIDTIPSVNQGNDDVINTIYSANQIDNTSSSYSFTTTTTNSSVSTLKTFDKIDFENDLIHLDAKFDVVQNMIKATKINDTFIDG